MRSIHLETRDEKATALLDEMLQRFGGDFPPTREFSDFARETSPSDCLSDPDEALMTWIEWEYELFKVLERHIVEIRLQDDFNSVDEFLSYSLSVQNRRKARTGRALENHMAHIFEMHGLRFSNGSRTENNSRPDFLFPGIEEYRVADFDSDRLTMLGAKTTCKDRWRQVLTEAARCPEKYLLTREEDISENQTDEMQSNRLQLVVPRRLQTSYSANQRAWLFDVAKFIRLVREKQG